MDADKERAGEVSNVERRKEAIDRLLEKDAVTPEVLSLMSRDNLSRVAAYYKIDVDLSSAANKLEAENMLAAALEEQTREGDDSDILVDNGKDPEKGEPNQNKLSMELELLRIRQQLQETQSQNLQLFSVLRDSLNTGKRGNLDCLRRVDYLPKYVDGENIEAYLLQFEHAVKDVFPEDVWARLLLVRLTGAARDAVQAMPVEEQSVYSKVKQAIQLKFRKIPEYYRRGFRNLEKGSSTHVEFLSKLIEKQKSWLDSEQVDTFEDLKQLVLREAFFSKIFPEVREYLNDKTGSLQEIALLADKFACMKRLGSKKPFRNNGNGKQPFDFEDNRSGNENPDSRRHNDQKSDTDTTNKVNYQKQKEEAGNKVSCFRCGFLHVKSNKCPDYIANLRCRKCNQTGHGAKVCGKSKSSATVGIVANSRKPRYQAGGSKSRDKCTGTVQDHGFMERRSNEESAGGARDRLEDGWEKNKRRCSPKSNAFSKYCYKATVKVDGKIKHVTALRDTGSAQTIITRNCLPQEKKVEKHVLLKSIEGKSFSCPLVMASVQVKDLGLNTRWQVAVMESLAYFGVDMIIGNDIIDMLDCEDPIVGKIERDPCAGIEDKELIFPSCAVTRAQSHLNGITRSETVNKKDEIWDPAKGPMMAFEKMSRQQLIAEQKQDSSLKEYFHLAVRGDKGVGGQCFDLDDDLLVRKWRPRSSSAQVKDGDLEKQLVVPVSMRKGLLKVAHDLPLGGHMGIAATLTRLRRNFFWPSMGKDVKTYVKTCHTCQKIGKPGNRVPKAPLRPLPIVSVPFSRIQIDCVGPLPKSSSGHEYLLTIMCLGSRYPEAIPLRSIRAENIVKELTDFFCRFGWPKTIQSDNGTNFKGKVFQDFCRSNGIEHVTSVFYHPQSQGCVERYHSTLKAMLNACAMENPKKWHVIVPQVLFCTRTTVHTSLGFTPAEIVFGHCLKGPLEIIKDKYINKEPEANVLDVVNLTKENYFRIKAMANKHLEVSKAAMKLRYDVGKKKRSFEVGDEVLVFLPTEKSMFHAKFDGPYKVVEKFSDINYRIETPTRKQKSRVVHINQIKLYNDRQNTTVGVLQPAEDNDIEQVDEYRIKEVEIPSPKLQNSQILENLDAKLEHVPRNGRENLARMMMAYRDVFRDTLGKAKVTPISIKLKEGAKPCYRHPYRYSPDKIRAIEEDTEFLLENNLAEPHIGEWSSPPVVVPKEGGEMRVCQDYRMVNKLIEADAHPLPRILDCIDTVGGSKFLTKMDLMKGFFQLPIDEKSSDILAFSTQKGLFRYKVLPFGVKIAPSAFQRVMNYVLRDLEDVRCYIDDVVIFSDDWDTHMETIGKVLERFREHDLVINLSKSEFAMAEITYLGHRVGGGKVRPKQANIKAIVDMKPPTSVKGVRRLLGSIGFYRRFVPNFAKLAHPLTELLKKNRKFIWSIDCERSFRLLKSLIESDPILKAPDFTKPFSLFVDASGTGIGAMLSQIGDDGVDMPVAFYSKKLNKHQRSYAPIELECLALVRALEHFEVYLLSGFTVDVHTDHNSLVFLDRMRNTNQKLLRWAIYLQRYDLNIKHIRGVENVMADMLSRLNEEVA